MRIWEVFDYNELCLMAGWEFGLTSTSMTRTTKGRLLIPSKEMYLPRSLVPKEVIRLRVSSFSLSRHADNKKRGYHLYFHSAVLPVHIAIHPTDTANNFHLSITDPDLKKAYVEHAASTKSHPSYAVADFLVKDTSLSSSSRLVMDPKASKILHVNLVPFLAKHFPKLKVDAYMEAFVSHFLKLINVWYKQRWIHPKSRSHSTHDAILDLPYYPDDIKRYLLGKCK